MIYYSPDSLAGGKTAYGCVVGLLSLHSTAPRIPGDPVNAQTFGFPVCHAVVEDVTIRDLIALDSKNMHKIISVAKELEGRGVRFIATSCGLFAPFQKVIGDQLRVPFLSSALQIVACLKGFLPSGRRVCVFTAHSGLLTEEHLRQSGFSLNDVVVKGMEDYPEFSRIVLDDGANMNPEKFRQDVSDAASDVVKSGRPVDMAVLECPSLITFRSEVQRNLGVPVFDIVNMIEFFAAAYRIDTYFSAYI
jgi:hypothetical protein